MNRPPYGISLPCIVNRVLDGDTIEVRLKEESPYVWKVRLIDCWCPETRTRDEKVKAKGMAAKVYAATMLEQHAGALSLYVPIEGHVENIIHALVSFDRLLGHIFLDPNTTLSEVLVAAGHGTRAKVIK